MCKRKSFYQEFLQSTDLIRSPVFQLPLDINSSFKFFMLIILWRYSDVQKILQNLNRSIEIIKPKNISKKLKPIENLQKKFYPTWE